MPAPGGPGVYQCVQNSSNALFLLGYYHARERPFVKLANNDKTLIGHYNSLYSSTIRRS